VDMAVEIDEQLWKCDKGKWLLLVTDVLVITLSALVVVTQHASALMNQRQTVFEGVRASGQGLR